MKFIRSARARVALLCVSAMALSLAVVSSASATAAYDLTPATTSITDQITAVLTVVLPIAGGIVALFLGWKILKRFVKA